MTTVTAPQAKCTKCRGRGKTGCGSCGSAKTCVVCGGTGVTSVNRAISAPINKVSAPQYVKSATGETITLSGGRKVVVSRPKSG